MATKIKITPETLAVIEGEYATAQDSWTGCDWTEVRYDGNGGQIDLDGVTADAAEDNADNADLSAAERAAWVEAREWLRGVESAAVSAEEDGEAAITAVRAGDLAQALRHVESACSRERNYGDCPTWRPLRDAIESVIKLAELEDE